MITFVSTLAELRDAVDSMVQATGNEKTPVVCHYGPRRSSESAEARLPTVDSIIQLELVWIDGNDRIVGDEANDYEKVARPGDRPAILVS